MMGRVLRFRLKEGEDWKAHSGGTSRWARLYLTKLLRPFMLDIVADKMWKATLVRSPSGCAPLEKYGHMWKHHNRAIVWDTARWAGMNNGQTQQRMQGEGENRREDQKRLC